MAKKTAREMSEQWVTWCSFADDDGCRGVLILEGALDPAAASLHAHATGQNPGGQLLAVPIAVREFPVAEQAAVLDKVGKLLSGDEALALFEGQTIGEFEAGQEN